MSIPGGFELRSDYRPSGDQPEAILKLVEGVERGDRYQTLLGATGTGKTFTIANVVQAVQKPTLVLAHNKTLAAQLCNEFRQFFPDNAVEYFVSYYDYYQPEAYIPRTDTYIEKEAMINAEIDRLRHSATQSLLTRRDVIICASVSCIYGLGAPEAYEQTILHLSLGDDMARAQTLERLIEMQFTRTNADLLRGTFRARGEVLDVMPVNEETVYRIEAPRGLVERIIQLDPVTRQPVRERNDIWIFPAKHFITLGPERERAIRAIRSELKERLTWFEANGKLLEAERLDRRTKYDLELIENLGYCNGIENYSRPLSGRAAGEAPDTLLAYFPEDFLLVVDESHVTVPQIGAMSEGDRARKATLIEHGFRLPSAADNRPLKFSEFEQRIKQAIFVSATPAEYELKHATQVVEQIIRPTGLVDPEVIVRPITAGRRGEPPLPRSLSLERRGRSESDSDPDLNPLLSKERVAKPGEVVPVGQIEDLMQRARQVVARGERILVTTLTKKMAEDLTDYLKEQNFKVRYMHSGIETVERLEILSEFRKGTYDMIVGVNLLREGLDLPEVSLVAILDADKEGFLRSETSLIQTIGRAARNVRGQVVLYADQMTGSMRRAIAETDRRRTKQLAYNKLHGITPRSIIKAQADLRAVLGLSIEEKDVKEILKLELSAETHDLEKVLKQKMKEMKTAAKDLEFELAAILRDEIGVLEKEIASRNTQHASKITQHAARNMSKTRKPRHGRTR